jgi:hypothetical protein
MHRPAHANGALFTGSETRQHQKRPDHVVKVLRFAGSEELLPETCRDEELTHAELVTA